MRSEIRDEVIRGIATVLWACAWADHVEEHDCYNLSGCQIEEHMPAIPWCAWLAAGRLLRRVEKAHGTTIEVILLRAAEMDLNEHKCGRVFDADADDVSDLAGRFGECMAYEAMGAGVGWADDHAEIPFYDVPYGEFYDLQYHAESTCKHDSDRVPCVSCSCYVEPGHKCSNCGTWAAALEMDATVN